MTISRAMRLGLAAATVALLAGCAGGFEPAQNTSGVATSSTSFAPNTLNHPDIAGGPPNLISHSGN